MSMFDASLLESVFRFTTPLLLAALGGLLCQRAGVFNVALEGLMLSGAFAAVVGSHISGSAAGGVVLAVVAASFLAAIFALVAVTLRGNEIVVGLAINLLAGGLTVYLLRTIFGVKGAFRHPQLSGLVEVALPGLDAVPLLGALLSRQSALVYLSWLLVAVVYVGLQHGVVGLRLRGVGEHAEAAATLGVSVASYRYGAILACGALCGLAGAQLSLGNVTLFVENMSAGRGWIAVVAVLLARAHPLGVVAASLLFGLADSVSFRLQGVGLPSQLTETLPYVVTLLSLAVVSKPWRRKARGMYAS